MNNETTLSIKCQHYKLNLWKSFSNFILPPLVINQGDQSKDTVKKPVQLWRDRLDTLENLTLL